MKDFPANMSTAGSDENSDLTPATTICLHCGADMGIDINNTPLDSIFICECGRRVMRTDEQST